MSYLRNFYKNAIKGTIVESFEAILIILTIILSCIFPDDKYFFLIGATIIYIFHEYNESMELKKKQMSIDMYDTEIPQVLDNIINESFDEYFLYHKGFEKGKAYINAEEEKDILRIMVDLVSARLSESTIAKLEAYYNKDRVPNIISSKIYMAITSYVVQANIPQQDPLGKINFNDTDEDRNEVITRYL